MKKTCFAIMPFDGSFEDIRAIIAKSSAAAGLRYFRGDLHTRPGRVLDQIVQELRHAAVVVADVTDNNPNVLYELGIAHQIVGEDRVVIIGQEVRDKSVPDKQPFDIHQFRQLRYTHSKEGRSRLQRELPERIQEAAGFAADQESWRVIRGRLSRTRMIVKDLKRLVEDAGDEGLKRMTIRVVAGLSSLAISDNEPRDSNLDDEYWQALIEERDSLRAALLAGARLKAVLNPPRRFAETLVPARLQARYQRMIGLLRGRSDIVGNDELAQDDLKAVKRCEFVLSPIPMPNMFIIGDIIAYEGLKRGGTGGFEMTHWETDKDELAHLCKDFDRLFDDSRRDLKRTHPGEKGIVRQLEKFLREARALEKRRRRARNR